MTDMEINFKKYLVQCSERSVGPQCNDDYVWVVESSVQPTKALIILNHFVYPGSCSNVTYPGCDECGGSSIVSFQVEPFSPERAKQLGVPDDSVVRTLKKLR
jgi:hypothetical protein